MVDVNPQQSHITVTVTPTSTTSEITISPSGTSATAGVNYGAEIYAQRAEGYANQASTSATLAGNYATSAQASATEASNSASSALASSTSASNYATTANISMTNASIWAEGTDAEVQELGGEHSAKNWADIAAESAPSATVTKTGTTSTLTVTDIHGTTTVEIEDGEKGDTGEPGLPNTLTIGTVEKTTNASASITGTSPNQVLNLGLPKGDTGSTGATGNGIQSITLISTVGLTKTYRITYTDGTTFDYEVKDGASGATQWGGITGSISDQTDLNTALNGKQSTLVSGTNIKTINNTSLLGSGNITIQSAPAIDNSTITQNANQQLQASALVDQRSGISKVWTGTKAQFDAIASKDSNTIYNVTDDYTGNSVAVVQETGNSTSNVMSQKAVTEYPAIQNVYSPTMLFKKPTTGGQRYAQSLKTYTLDELKDVNIIQRAIRPSGTGINHYDAGGIPAIYLYKDNNNFIFFGVSGYSVKSTIKINGVMLEDVTLFTFSPGAGNINTSLNAYYRLDLHNKKMIMKNINETTGVEQILTEHDFSSLDISAFSDFYIRSGHSIYEIPVAVQHLAVNSILDYNTMLSQKLEYGRYNAFQTTDYNSNLVVASNGVAIAGTLSLDEPNHKISTVSQATMGYFKMGVKGTSATENTMNAVQCFKLKVTDGTMKIQIGASVNYGYVCEGDKVVYKLSSTPFTLTNNVEYTVYLKTFHTVNYARNYSFYAQGDFTVDISDGFLTFPASVNLCAETYNGKYFRGGLPCSGVNEEFLNYDNLFTTWNAYPSIPLYTQQVDTNGNILMFNGTAWKQVSN